MWVLRNETVLAEPEVLDDALELPAFTVALERAGGPASVRKGLSPRTSRQAAIADRITIAYAVDFSSNSVTRA